MRNMWRYVNSLELSVTVQVETIINYCGEKELQLLDKYEILRRTLIAKTLSREVNTSKFYLCFNKVVIPTRQMYVKSLPT